MPGIAGSDYSDDNYSLGPVKVSTINFVDLAGSERGSYSGHEGAADRIRQTEVFHLTSILTIDQHTFLPDKTQVKLLCQGHTLLLVLAWKVQIGPKYSILSTEVVVK